MKIFILTLIFFFNQMALASYLPIETKTPQEFHYIINALQSDQLYSHHKEKINTLIIQIDRTFSSLNNNDINLIIKSEIFRTLLKFPPSNKRSFRSLNPNMANDLYNLSKKITSPFLSWLALSIHTDLKLLFRSPRFPSFKKSIEIPNQKWDKKMALMKKKFSLLLPWHDYLVNTPEKQLIKNIYPLLLKCLQEIHFKSSLYSSLVPTQPPSQGKMQYFKKILPTKEKNPIDSLLNPIIKHSKDVSLPEPVDDWIPEKDSYTQKLPLPTNDWLPEPVDDWSF